MAWWRAGGCSTIKSCFALLQDVKSEPTVDFLTSGSKSGDDNMEFSDSESDEPRRYKSGTTEKNIAHLKVTWKS